MAKRPGKKLPSKQPPSKPPAVERDKIVSRLELAAEHVSLTVPQWMSLCKIILPEEFGDNGPAPNPLRGKPNELRRLDEMRDRETARYELFRSNDAVAPENEAIILSGEGRSGTLAPARRTNETTGDRHSVVYSYQMLQGVQRATLPEVSGRVIVGTQKRGKKRKKADPVKLKRVLRRALEQKNGDMTAYVMTFPSRLREARLAKGLSQGQMAKRLGVTQSLIAKYESGIRIPPVVKLERLSSIFDATVLEMVFTTWPK